MVLEQTVENLFTTAISIVLWFYSGEAIHFVSCMPQFSVAGHCVCVYVRIGSAGLVAYGRIVSAFNDGDLDAIAAMAPPSFGSDENGRVAQRVLVRDRNRAWMPALRSALLASNVVIIAGAAHLPGRDGLVAMLPRAEYRVTSTVLAADQVD